MCVCVCVCVCVYLANSLLFKHAWLNNKDTSCLYNFIKVLKKNKRKILKSFKSTLYTCKQPLMIAYKNSESARDNFGKFIHQFQPETKTLIRKLERILIKLYRQNVSLYIYIYIYIYIYMQPVNPLSSCKDRL